MEFQTGSTVSFLNLNFQSIKNEPAMVALYATDTNTIASTNGLVADTDGDGLDERLKFQERLSLPIPHL